MLKKKLIKREIKSCEKYLNEYWSELEKLVIERNASDGIQNKLNDVIYLKDYINTLRWVIDTSTEELEGLAK